MKFLVTGGSGFIGSHLIKRLKELGEVVSIDKLSSNDIRDDLSEKFKGVDYVFHLAGLHLPKDMKNLDEVHSTNVDGTRLLLEQAKKAGVKKFIFSSSAAVYGDGDGPINHYGLSKKLAEQLCNFYDNTTILRYSNVYGKGGSGFINILIKCKEENKSPTIFGTGQNKRDYIHVSDIVEANIWAMNQTGTFNISTNESHSPNELCRILNLNPKYVTAKNEIRDSKLDNSIAISKGWKPKIKLEFILEAVK